MRVLDRIDLAEIRALHERDEFFWLDVLSPSDEELDALMDVLGLPPLAVQDSKEFGQRPKIDDYADRALIVFFGAEGAELVEVHVHVSGSEVVTVRHERCAHLGEALRQAADGGMRSEEELVFRILDALADSLGARVGDLTQEIEHLSEVVFERALMAERRRIGALRGELFRLSQYVDPQREMLAEGGGELIACLPGLERDEFRHLFRDVHDELVETATAIAYQRELLSEALTVYLSTVNNRLNETLKRLTIISIIFLPLTFVTGFFGQNFGWLVDHIRPLWAFLVYGVGGLVVSGVVLYAYFRRRGYTRPDF
jgi:magnesium transporter